MLECLRPLALGCRVAFRRVRPQIQLKIMTHGGLQNNIESLHRGLLQGGLAAFELQTHADLSLSSWLAQNSGVLRQSSHDIQHADGGHGIVWDA